MTKHFSDNEPYILVETEVINFDDIKSKKIKLMHYIIEIYSKTSDELGVVCHDEDGEQTITKFDSFSQAKVQESKIKDQLGEDRLTRIVSIDEDKAES